MRNFDHLKQLSPRGFIEAIINITENCCLCCPRERERRCNEDCVGGLVEWLYSEFIPGSIIWKKRRKK